MLKKDYFRCQKFSTVILDFSSNYKQKKSLRIIGANNRRVFWFFEIHLIDFNFLFLAYEEKCRKFEPGFNHYCSRCHLSLLFVTRTRHCSIKMPDIKHNHPTRIYLISVTICKLLKLKIHQSFLKHLV